MLKTTTPYNRWKSFLSIPYPHVITFGLVWQHHDVFQTSATASKRLRIEPKSAAYVSNFLKPLVSETCLLLKIESTENFNSGTKWKKNDCSTCSLHSKNYVTFNLTTRKHVANFCDKHPKSKSCKLLFGWCRCFRAYRLITMAWNVKRIVPSKRWETSYQSHIFVC